MATISAQIRSAIALTALRDLFGRLMQRFYEIHMKNVMYRIAPRRKI